MPDVVRSLMNAFRESVKQDSSIEGASKDALLREVDKAYEDEPPPVLAIIGEAGVGKSTTINSLFNAGQEVGHFTATTLQAVGLDVYVDHVRGRRGDLQVIDMPGVGDDWRNYDRYLHMYLDTLPRADAILWVHPASDRMVAFMQQVVGDLVKQLPGLRTRIVFGLNKADEMYPGDWNPLSNTPSEAQLRNLDDRIADFAKRIQPHINVKRPAVVPYSALRRYNLATLFRTLMEAVPKPRRWVLESRMALADFVELVDRGMLSAAQQHVQQPAQPATAHHAGAPVRVVPSQPERSGPRTVPLDLYLDGLTAEEYAALVEDKERFLKLLRSRGNHA